VESNAAESPRRRLDPNVPSPLGGSAKRVGKDAVVLMAGDLVDRALGFVFLFTATKIYGLEIYGTYLFALGVFHVIRTLVSFGLGKSLVKDTAAAAAVEDYSRLKGAIVLGFAISLTLAVFSGVALFFGAGELVSLMYPTQPMVTAPLQVFGLLTPVFAANFVLLQALYGLGRIRSMVVANNLIEPTARYLALLAFFAAGVSGYVALPFAYLAALVFSSLFALAVFSRHVWSLIATVRAEYRVKETLAFVVPVTLNDLGTRSFRTFNIAVFAAYRTAVEVSLFSIALKLTSVVFLFSNALIGAFRPRISALLAERRTAELSAETRIYNLWILTFAALPYGLMLAFPADILAALGPQFVAAAPPMRIMCVGLLLAQGAGPLFALLLMSGRSKQALYFIAAAASVYTLAALQAVPRYGMVGAAACAVACVYVFVPIVSLYVGRALGISMYGRAMLKPIAAICIAVAAGSVVWLVLPSAPPEVAGQFLRIGRAVALVGVTAAVYVAVLAKLGYAQEEKALIAGLLGPFANIKRKLKRIVRGARRGPPLRRESQSRRPPQRRTPPHSSLR
jgi:O-antigen/teichoic acid export membrane protein